jgi:DNA sulfur modification protein DndC
LVGTRTGESRERDRTLMRHAKPGETFFFRQAGNSQVELFAPIADFSTEDVWSTLSLLPKPAAIDVDHLLKTYRDAGAECPVVRDAQGTPCGAGRFGCWTCTVVRKDKAVSSLVASGHSHMAPLLEFRNWLAAIRDEPSARCRWRRNGVKGLGPLTLAARREALLRLLRTQRTTGLQLIRQREVDLIRKLWSDDRLAASYKE